MTDPHCNSGTDRAAEVVRGLPDARLIVNLQGDEPEIDPNNVDEVIRLLSSDPDAKMATLATPITNEKSLTDPACVKVVFDEDGRAIYFSRSPIPFVRDPVSLPTSMQPHHYQHLGIYAYRRDFLLELASWRPSRLEQMEMLEQLRVIERGTTIKVGVVPTAARGIDTLKDYADFVARCAIKAHAREAA